MSPIRFDPQAVLSVVTEPLSAVKVGATVMVHHLIDHAGANRLRELGVDTGRFLRIVRSGDPIVCEVGGARLGFGRNLAQCILVNSSPFPMEKTA